MNSLLIQQGYVKLIRKYFSSGEDFYTVKMNSIAKCSFEFLFIK